MISYDRLKTEFDRRTMVRGKGPSVTIGLYTDMGSSGASAIHAVPLTLPRVCLRERGWNHQWLNLTPVMTTNESAISLPRRLGRAIT